MGKPLAERLTPSQATALAILAERGLRGAGGHTTNRNVPGTSLVASGSAKALVRLGLARWRGAPMCSPVLITPTGQAIAAALKGDSGV